MEIHHIGYLTKNTKEGVHQFRNLGFAVETPTLLDEIRKINITFMINDGYRVEIIEPINEESLFWGLLKKYKNTPYHVCYLTENIEKEIIVLQEEGYLVIQEPKPAPCIRNQRVAFLIHKDMGIIELLEEKK